MTRGESSPQQLRRRGFRLILTAVIAGPIVLLMALFAAISNAFCGVENEVDACEQSASNALVFFALLALLLGGMFVAGIIMRVTARARSPLPQPRSSTEYPGRGESSKEVVSVVLAVLCWPWFVAIEAGGTGGALLGAFALLINVPATFVVAWGADAERRHDLDGRHSPRAIAAVTATLLCLALLWVF